MPVMPFELLYVEFFKLSGRVLPHSIRTTKKFWHGQPARSTAEAVLLFSRQPEKILMNRTTALLSAVILSAALCTGLFLVKTTTSTKQKQASDFSAATISISPVVDTYLQNSLLYGNYYNENQKFVIYNAKENTCPYSFINAVRQISQIPGYNKKYVFLPWPENTNHSLPEENAGSRDFLSICTQFCIVNPARREIFYIKNISEEDSHELPHVFRSLENW